MKNILLAVFVALVCVSCNSGSKEAQEAKDKAKQLSDAAKTELGKAVEQAEKVAQSAQDRAEELAEQTEEEFSEE